MIERVADRCALGNGRESKGKAADLPVCRLANRPSNVNIVKFERLGRKRIQGALPDITVNVAILAPVQRLLPTGRNELDAVFTQW